MSVNRISEYRDTPLWKALTTALEELAASRELSVNTAPEYVVDYLCRELAAKKLVAPLAGETRRSSNVLPIDSNQSETPTSM